MPKRPKLHNLNEKVQLLSMIINEYLLVIFSTDIWHI